MTNYRDFLTSKRRVWTGQSIAAGSLPSALFDWQAAIVRWSLRKGRAAVFADCGLMVLFSYGTKKTTRESNLRGVRSRIRNARMSTRARARAILFEGLPRQVEAPRFSVVLRVVRLAILPTIRRAGSWCRGAAVLFARVLSGLASREAHQLSEGWRAPQASGGCGGRVAAGATTGRSRSSHRRGQAELSPVEFGCIPLAVRACALPLRGDVRR